MTQLKTDQLKKDILLFVGRIPSDTAMEIKEHYAKLGKKKIRIANIVGSRAKTPTGSDEPLQEGVDLQLISDFSSDLKIAKAIMPIVDEVFAVTCREERSIPYLQRVIAHIPYVRTPTARSLTWATHKVLMRQRLATYDKKITPEFTVAYDAKKATLKGIEDKVGFPVVIKPAGLAQSMLVSICYHREELEKELRKTFRQIAKVYKNSNRHTEPAVLVEHFMEGEQYSIDSYVSSRGKVTHCPVVHVKTGRAIGFDDFFGYQQMTPTILSKESVEKAELTAEKAIKALGMRSTTVHIELLKADTDWKVIELGPRVGGFRKVMYELSYGFNHSVNDVLVRVPEAVNVSRRVKGYTAAMKFFAPQEGVLTKLSGIKKATELKSFKNIKVNKKIGDRCLFAKNGGLSVFNIILFNTDRPKLLADIRRLEQMVSIETELTQKKAEEVIKKKNASSTGNGKGSKTATKNATATAATKNKSAKTASGAQEVKSIKKLRGKKRPSKKATTHKPASQPAAKKIATKKSGGATKRSSVKGRSAAQRSTSAEFVEIDGV